MEGVDIFLAMATYQDHLWVAGNRDVYRVSLTDGSYTKIAYIDRDGNQARTGQPQGRSIVIDGDTGYIIWRLGSHSRIYKFDPSCSNDSCETHVWSRPSNHYDLGVSCGAWAYGGKLYVSQCSGPTSLQNWDLSCTEVDSNGEGNCAPTEKSAHVQGKWNAGMVNPPTYERYANGASTDNFQPTQPLVYDGNLYLGTKSGVIFRWALQEE
jgi:WD40 repeat protein